MSDLQALNDAVPLANGSLPFEQWLEQAIYLTCATNWHGPFEQALVELRQRTERTKLFVERSRDVRKPDKKTLRQQEPTQAGD